MITTAILAELEHARRAQAEGNLGRARVCVRRATGWALREISGFSGDALKQLKWLRDQGTAPETVRAAATRLTTQVGHDHALPFEQDLLADAQTILDYVERMALLP